MIHFGGSSIEFSCKVASKVITFSLRQERLDHIFGQEKHNWSRTGLDTQANIDLIRRGIEQGLGRAMEQALPDGGRVLTIREHLGGYPLVIKLYQAISGELSLSNAYIQEE